MNKKIMGEKEVLEVINEGHSAYSLLLERFPTAQQKFDRLCKNMVSFLSDIKSEFPDARYYTASGGFNLMLGSSHDLSGMAQQELVALEGSHGVSISDGDF